MNPIAQIKIYKWRAALVIVNVALLFGLCFLGLRQYERDHNLHPGYFYHGNLYYIPPAQIAAYCLNAPAYFTSGLLGEVLLRYTPIAPHVVTAHILYDVTLLFIIATASLWWYIGWLADSLDHYKVHSPPGRAAVVICSLVGIFSIGLGTDGLGKINSHAFVRAVAVAEFGWGIVLGTLSFLRVWRAAGGPPFRQPLAKGGKVEDDKSEPNRR